MMSANQSQTTQARRSVTEKKQLLTEWQQSTLTMKKFCSEKEISLSRLKTWIKQFDMGRKRYPRKKVSSQFISIIPDRPLHVSTPFAELLLSDNSRLVINQPVTATFLKELLHAAK